MIKHFLDHSANERTYLSWIGTSIAIMAFGFVVERFDIFIHYMSKALGSKSHFKSTASADIVGICLLLLAVVMIITATARYFIQKKEIDSEKELSYKSLKTIFFLAAVMVVLGIFLSTFMWTRIV